MNEDTMNNNHDSKHDQESKSKEEDQPKKEKKDFWGSLGDFVKKSIDCCLE